MTQRSEFLHAAARGRKSAMPGLVLQAVRPVNSGAVMENLTPGSVSGSALDPALDSVPFRVGFTASKRVGGAIARNRAKRRLREAVARVMPGHAKPGYDYVVIARAATLHRKFDDLLQDLETALARVGAK
jgi:ribonuclease P protein component